MNKRIGSCKPLYAPPTARPIGHAALSSTLGRYVPKVLAARRRGDSDRLGGESRFVAVLFADIRGFTRFAESRTPGDVVTTLNRALSEITTPVLRHNGILDKYVGGGLLAFFEPFVNQQDAVRNAVAAAREMQRVFAALTRPTWRLNCRPAARSPLTNQSAPRS